MNTIGFPNLDLYSDHEHGGEESFWPSFTDIMMVIVMTFLLITVAVMLNNWKLIDELKGSIAAERQAMAKAQSALQVVQAKSAENETLEERLTRLEALLATRTQNLQNIQQQYQQTQTVLQQTRQQLDASQQQLTANQQQLDSSQQELADAQSVIQRLQQESKATASTVASLQQSLEQQKQETARLLQEKSAAEEATKDVDEKLASVNKALEATGKELHELRQKDKEGHERLLSLQGEYDKLDKKYQKLLRPARSSKNKHVVRVIFSKNNGKFVYEIADAGQSPKIVSQERLHQELAQLKEKYTDNLYVKVIIPESSTVSHTEAWKFTSDILNRYDYYHSQ